MTNTITSSDEDVYPDDSVKITNLRNTINEQAKVIHQLEMTRVDTVTKLKYIQGMLDSLKQSLDQLREANKESNFPFLVEANTFLDRWTGDS